jgi:hypothetical protein
MSDPLQARSMNEDPKIATSNSLNKKNMLELLNFDQLIKHLKLFTIFIPELLEDIIQTLADAFSELFMFGVDLQVFNQLFSLLIKLKSQKKSNFDDS